MFVLFPKPFLWHSCFFFWCNTMALCSTFRFVFSFTVHNGSDCFLYLDFWMISWHFRLGFYISFAEFFFIYIYFSMSWLLPNMFWDFSYYSSASSCKIILLFNGSLYLADRSKLFKDFFHFSSYTLQANRDAISSTFSCSFLCTLKSLIWYTFHAHTWSALTNDERHFFFLSFG